MGRRKRKQAEKQGSGKLSIDRKRRSGHYQGHMYSEIYRDGQVYVSTAWDDNEPEVGAPMDFDAWVRSRR